MAERGRPSTYTPEVADEILSRLLDGETLLAICRSEHLPSESTVRTWVLDDREGFYARYTRARQVGYERMADEVVEISDDGRNDTYEDEEGNERTDNDVIQRSRLRVDTRKWLLSKVLPKVYGDKVEHEVKGRLLIISEPR